MRPFFLTSGSSSSAEVSKIHSTDKNKSKTYVGYNGQISSKNDMAVSADIGSLVAYEPCRMIDPSPKPEDSTSIYEVSRAMDQWEILTQLVRGNMSFSKGKYSIEWSNDGGPREGI
ncbi:hypothetical protein PILCRDRAFT_635594 [Piloderma croceum F 1598]|uniref:Uncharacterized protein n=1 Tax=Piloderma croceum (strain F 1598) TaxID=765440 RepID=A0A0C3BHS9_PILCF|nr:hypothetical protein PILCRDRAFT_635594 [Piloderma croceum F 1598]